MPKTRRGTKQARLIAMLESPEDASIAEIAEATRWQPHTVRGAIAGALKMKLGLAVTSETVEGRLLVRSDPHHLVPGLREDPFAFGRDQELVLDDQDSYGTDPPGMPCDKGHAGKVTEQTAPLSLRVSKPPPICRARPVTKDRPEDVRATSEWLNPGPSSRTDNW